ncbi:hypothetical protein [Tahibacter harae]|uniref:Uncharacterized protein n=1 Tax=Tahibacter harae TaxID=2963937 RepID=A0ABT1QS72_9GAMM|nr:hypothetical protein [Tahibacter harae]MCQ4165111.1 hypothetical protein [Tahibacter harae]
MRASPRTIRATIIGHAVGVEVLLVRASDAASAAERGQCLQRAERRAESALSWARLLSAPVGQGGAA